MTDAELSEFIANPPDGAISVRMSRAGVFLIAGSTEHKIDSRQAAVLWEAMPLMAQVRAARADGQ